MTETKRTDPVVVCSRLTAEGVIPPPGAVVISITNPSQSPARLQDGWAAVLRLKFHDTERPMGNFQLMIRGIALGRCLNALSLAGLGMVSQPGRSTQG